jgi:hypothetical protein
MADQEFDLKKVSKELGEDVVKAVVSKLVIPYVKHLVEKSENKIDDLAVAFLPQLEKALLDLADKIDKEG